MSDTPDNVCVYVCVCVCQTHLEEERDRRRRLNRSCFRLCILYLTRGVVNLVVLGFLVGVVAVIVFVTDETSQVSCIRIACPLLSRFGNFASSFTPR